ncbi:D-tyrosyl-tRNA(Tyr) deacylase [Lacticaseibacillus camelliae DSM 22697 = JCM 13995]|uniref:D-aminoacyl-tRNA deacylase n=1 Tax=Lacticaseibacillus camelliae DSM 22697 = JCM 13995 TaxID=1423730 RepID=A0A0R2F0W2_9LACO|nr:D-tyrosyl-tRNA(Tyr) deacylase [Lacticaseibacillus camelliae DSM 22697 = JCM 13995]
MVQRVSRASVSIEGQVTGEVGQGFLILLGVGPNDSAADVDYLVNKISKLRVFSDDQGKMNRALAAVGGSVLVVSQFTLYADTRKGNRPSFTGAAAPELGERLYEAFLTKFAQTGARVAHGEFGADMQVSLTNDGPVTIIFDTEEQHAG